LLPRGLGRSERIALSVLERLDDFRSTATSEPAMATLEGWLLAREASPLSERCFHAGVFQQALHLGAEVGEAEADPACTKVTRQCFQHGRTGAFYDVDRAAIHDEPFDAGTRGSYLLEIRRKRFSFDGYDTSSASRSG
jgi:hypothetical protein